MDDTKRLENLGKLVHNMQTLEFMLRGILFADEITKGISKQLTNNPKFEKGELLPVNAFTNWDSLYELVQKYNQLPISKGFEIDETLVEIRNAIAHGRVFLYSLEGNIHLVKFKIPKGNEVEIEFSEWMTEEWVGKQNDRFFEAIIMVDKVNKKQQSGRSIKSA